MLIDGQDWFGSLMRWATYNGWSCDEGDAEMHRRKCLTHRRVLDQLCCIDYTTFDAYQRATPGVEPRERTAAPSPVGDPLSWFQEQRNSLTKIEYDSAEDRARIDWPKRPGTDEPVIWREGERSANVVSLSEYRTRP